MIKATFTIHAGFIGAIEAISAFKAFCRQNKFKFDYEKSGLLVNTIFAEITAPDGSEEKIQNFYDSMTKIWSEK